MKVKKATKRATEKVVCKRVKKATAGVKKTTRSAKKDVTFTIHGAKGQSVYVAGDFNGWDPTAKKLAFKARQGLYIAKMKLAAGSYQYKFVVDGAWCADPANANAVPNDQGTFNSVIVVK